MNESDYKQLVRDRDKYKNMLKGPTRSDHRTWLEKRLVEIRTELSNAHKQKIHDTRANT
jgi:hypothetical protein